MQRELDATLQIAKGIVKARNASHYLDSTRWKRALLHGMALGSCNPAELERVRVALS